MESLGNTLLADGFRTLLEIYGKTVQLLKDGTSFVGLLSNDTVINGQTLLGADPREATFVFVLKDDVPAYLLAGNAQSQVPASIDGTHVCMTNRDNSLSNPFVRFELVKVV